MRGAQSAYRRLFTSMAAHKIRTSMVHIRSTASSTINSLSDNSPPLRWRSWSGCEKYTRRLFSFLTEQHGTPQNMLWITSRSSAMISNLFSSRKQVLMPTLSRNAGARHETTSPQTRHSMMLRCSRKHYAQNGTSRNSSIKLLITYVANYKSRFL